MIIDSRYSMECESLEQLLDTADLDDSSDLEDLLMILMRRPVDVLPSDGDQQPESFEVILHGHQFGLGTVFPFPLSLIDLVRSLVDAEEGSLIGRWEDGADADADADDGDRGPHLRDMDSEQLTRAIQGAFGQLGILGHLEED